ncbi:MAG: sigma-E processing peptidase SpoIIGA [Clostridia bacterium]|nr:sigma-E processing peptidase SpoIIGA [Clostridia bacterium]
MYVYADILVLVNFVVDYFLIAISSRFLHKRPRLWRQLLAAFLGGIFSLYIFLPQSGFVLQTVVQLLMSAAISLTAFGFGNIKDFARNTAVLFTVNFAYSGAMIAVWLAFRPHGMAINNSVVYFDISPLFLIAFSTVGYFAVTFLRRLLQKNFSQSSICNVVIICGNNTLKLDGIVDTGNALRDVFGLSQIFITETAVIDAVMGAEKHNKARFRAIPCTTVSGEGLLDGYRIDFAEVWFENKKHHFKNPILAASTTPLDECKIIVNPDNLN